MIYKKFKEELIIFSILTIPLFTLLFGLRKSPFKYTLSMMGNWFEYNTKFIVWGIITAIMLLFAIYNIYKKAKFENKNAFKFLYASAFFLILTVITPTIYEGPIARDLNMPSGFNYHGLFGMMFSVFLVISLYLFSRYLQIMDKKISIKSFNWLMITVGGSIAILFLFGLTGVFQLFFFITLAVFLYVMNTDVNKYLHKLRNK